MAVEIHILSGSQQGRCFRFDGDRILIGDVAVADVRFDPDRESRARGKNAVITLDDEEGWRISNVGAGVWLLNQTPVEASQTHRLRSEDLVRVSEAGPDFCFRIVAGPRGSAIPAMVSPGSGVREPAAALVVPPSGGIADRSRVNRWQAEHERDSVDHRVHGARAGLRAQVRQGRVSLFARLAASIGRIFGTFPRNGREEEEQASRRSVMSTLGPGPSPTEQASAVPDAARGGEEDAATATALTPTMGTWCPPLSRVRARGDGSRAQTAKANARGRPRWATGRCI